MIQNRIEEKIEEMYTKYCRFADITKPAPMNIKFTNDIDPYVEPGNPSTFGVNPRYFNLTDDRILSVMYHEFTHLNDYNTYFVNESVFNRKMLLLLFTEIHATIIELKISSGFKNVNDNILLTSNHQINSINGRISLNAFIEKSDNILGKSIDEFMKNKTKNKFIAFIKELGYAIGRKSFFSRYVQTQVEYPNLSKSVVIFGENIQKLIEIGDKDVITEKDMIDMSNMWIEIMLKHTK